MSVEEREPRKKDWVRIAFFILSPVIGTVGTAAHAWATGIRWWEPVLFLLLYALVGVSVTAGYHRLFAHRSYECHPAVQAFYLFFGAMALQNSILAWGSDHRIHHRYVDRDWDPYNIQRGGLWAHILWIFYQGQARPDLRRRARPAAQPPGAVAAPLCLLDRHSRRAGPSDADRLGHGQRRSADFSGAGSSGSSSSTIPRSS